MRKCELFTPLDRVSVAQSTSDSGVTSIIRLHAYVTPRSFEPLWLTHNPAQLSTRQLFCHSLSYFIPEGRNVGIASRRKGNITGTRLSRLQRRRVTLRNKSYVRAARTKGDCVTIRRFGCYIHWTLDIRKKKGPDSFLVCPTQRSILILLIPFFGSIRFYKVSVMARTSAL